MQAQAFVLERAVECLNETLVAWLADRKQSAPMLKCGDGAVVASRAREGDMWLNRVHFGTCGFDLAILSGIFEMAAEVIFAPIAEVNAFDTPD
ncbi:hypothetical protein C6P92_20515 [Burkholderia multivorans]|nr:hypothetical protein C6P92_20515 [Burkholderia multivorans]PRG32596.1 hypothetical protein C6T62_20480 [Burkholderia multivorans]